MQTERTNPTQVVDGDIIYVHGFRTRASDVVSYPDGRTNYTLTSAPNERHPDPLPLGYEKMRSGGNALAMVVREIS